MIYLNNNTVIQDVWVPRTVVRTETAPSRYVTEADLEQALSEYNPTDNFKTVNGETIIGTGNIEISAGDNVQWEQVVTEGTKVAEITIDSSTTEVFVPETDLSDYPTRSETDGMIASATSAFTTSGDVADMISAFTTTGDVQTQIDLSLIPYWTSAQTQSAITSSTSGYATTAQVETQITSALSDYYTSSETDQKYVARENGKRLMTDAEGTKLSGIEDGAEVNVQADWNVTASTSDAYIRNKPSLSGYFDYVNYDSANKQIVFKHGGSAGTTVGTVDATDFIKDGMVDDVYVSGGNLVIVFNMEAGKENIEIPISDIFDANNYYTTAQTYNKGEVDTAIYDATSGMVTTGTVENMITAATSAFTTSADVQSQISNSLIPYWTSAQTNSAITSATSGFVTTGTVESMITAATSAFTTSADVQTQVSTALEDYYTTAQTYNKGEVDNAITAATSAFTTSAQVQSQISTSLVPYWTSAQTNSAITSATENMATTGVVENMITAATSSLTTSAQVQSQITSALTGYNPTNNFKTINSNSIIGTGDIVIQGGGSDVQWNQIVTAGTKIAEVSINSAVTDVYAPNGGGGGGEQVIELTQAEYLALTAYSQNTTYVITDAEYIDMDDYYTSAQTDSAITTAIANKQDKVTTTANSSNRKFPLWNSGGQITGSTGNNVSSVGFSVNGSNQAGILRDNNSSNLTGIYAPTSAGSNGNILRSTGSGAPTWATPATLGLVSSTNATTIVVCSQTDYDNMGEHSQTTIYIISD